MSDKTLKELYDEFDDKNPKHQLLSDKADYAINEGLSSIEWRETCYLDKPIHIENFEWENYDLEEYSNYTIPEINFLNEKYYPYFEFSIYAKYIDLNLYKGMVDSLNIKYTLKVMKIRNNNEVKE